MRMFSFTLSHSKLIQIQFSRTFCTTKRHLENSQNLKFLRAKKSNHQKKPIPSLIAPWKSMVVFFFLKSPFEAEAYFQGSRPKIATPLKFNMSRENQWLEDVFPTEIVPFWGDMLVPRRVVLLLGVFFCQTSLPATTRWTSKGLSSQAPAPSKRRASRASDRASLEPAGRGLRGRGPCVPPLGGEKNPVKPIDL